MKNENEYYLDILSRLLGETDPKPRGFLSDLLDTRPKANPFSALIEESSSIPRLTSLRNLLGGPESLPSPIISAANGTMPKLRPLTVPAATRPAGIKFNNTVFTEPTLFSSAWLPMGPGVYVILMQDSSANPRPYREIYFGKAQNLSSEASRSHRSYLKWCIAAGGSARLFVSFYVMANSTDAQRSSLEISLIKSYAPRCNDQHNPLK